MLNRRLPNIIVPLTNEAFHLAFRDEFELSEEYEYLPIERKEVSIFSMDIISELILKTLNLEIDDFEMFICTEYKDLENLINELESNKEKIPTLNLDYANALSELASLAIKRKTGLFFRF